MATILEELKTAKLSPAGIPLKDFGAIYFISLSLSLSLF
jgi:hypothetical protein